MMLNFIETVNNLLLVKSLAKRGRFNDAQQKILEVIIKIDQKLKKNFFKFKFKF